MYISLSLYIYISIITNYIYIYTHMYIYIHIYTCIQYRLPPSAEDKCPNKSPEHLFPGNVE